MKMFRTLVALAMSLVAAAAFLATAQPTDTVTTAPVYVPDTSHQNDPLPPGIIAWDEVQKTVEATNGQEFAHFAFAFTNVATAVSVAQVTNFICATNFTIVTNKSFWQVFSGQKYSDVPSVTTNTSVVTVTNAGTPIPVAILNVHPSCGCTTAEVPSGTWLLPPGTNSVIRINVDLKGKSGMLFKTVTVTTDKGRLDLILRINIAPPPAPRPMTEEERAHGVAMARIDRQAVFKGDCVECHAKNVQGKYAQELFAKVCAVCHEANPRASMVPDLHNLKDPTSEEFWRAWITSGKPGTLMPAFATSQGGPLDDFQIASLATYLNSTIPSKVPSPTAK